MNRLRRAQTWIGGVVQHRYEIRGAACSTTFLSGCRARAIAKFRVRRGSEDSIAELVAGLDSKERVALVEMLRDFPEIFQMRTGDHRFAEDGGFQDIVTAAIRDSPAHKD